MPELPCPRGGGHCANLLVILSKLALRSCRNITARGGYGSIFRAFRRPDYRISQRADAAVANFNNISLTQGADTGGRASSNNVAGLERHHLRDVANYNIKGKNHFRGVSILFPDAIQERLDGEARRIERCLDNRAERTERVEALAARKLSVEPLDIARGHVIEAGVAENVLRNIFIGQQVPAAAADDRCEFAFVVNTLRNTGQEDRFVRSHDGRRRFQENQRFFGSFVVEFSRVLQIVAADADNFARGAWRKKLYGI